MSDLPLEFKNVSFYYDSMVLNAMNFTIQPGEITGLLGANGVGKSTLLKCAIGLLFPQTGTVTQFGVGIKELEQKERGLFGYDAVGVDFPAQLTVRQILDFVKSTYLNWDEALEKKLFSHFRLVDDLKFSRLSTGAQRKLGSMCAVCHRPKLILLDESLSGLDIESRLYIIDLLGELASQGASIVYATHILNDIERISDNVLVLKDGKTQKIESIDSIPEHYFFIEEGQVGGAPGAHLKRHEKKVLVQSNIEDMNVWNRQDVERNTYISANLESLYLSLVHGESVV